MFMVVLVEELNEDFEADRKKCRRGAGTRHTGYEIISLELVIEAI